MTHEGRNESVLAPTQRYGRSRSRRDFALALPSAFGPDQFDPLGELQPPRPAPRRHADHPERTAERVGERVRHIPVERDEARSQVPYERSAVRTQNPAYLGQGGRRVRPMVHRQRTDHEVE